MPEITIQRGVLYQTPSLKERTWFQKLGYYFDIDNSFDENLFAACLTPWLLSLPEFRTRDGFDFNNCEITVKKLASNGFMVRDCKDLAVQRVEISLTYPDGRFDAAQKNAVNTFLSKASFGKTKALPTASDIIESKPHYELDLPYFGTDILSKIARTILNILIFPFVLAYKLITFIPLFGMFAVKNDIRDDQYIRTTEKMHQFESSDKSVKAIMQLGEVLYNQQDPEDALFVRRERPRENYMLCSTSCVEDDNEEGAAPQLTWRKVSGIYRNSNFPDSCARVLPKKAEVAPERPDNCCIM
jgi:hypothetical protein